jgi:hypothetical protein
MAERLLVAGASPDSQKLPRGKDPMQEMIMFSHKGAIMMLLRHGADPRYADAFGTDRVRTAIGSENTEIAELLVEKGGSLFSVAEDGSMAVHDLQAQPVVFKNAGSIAARDRLIAKAKVSGLPWPPPDRAMVKQMVLAGQWPTVAMAKAGMSVSPPVLARMRAQQPPQ